ncbi:unnamed protein product, partial [Mesorhabditis spiculigera]
MRTLLYIVAILFSWAHARPAAQLDDAEKLPKSLDFMKINVKEMIPEDIFSEFSTDLQEFLENLQLPDLMSIGALVHKVEHFDDANDMLEALKESSPSTYKKVKKLVDAYELRYEALTPGARAFFDKVAAEDIQSLDGTERKIWANSQLEEYRKLPEVDKASVAENFPLIHKIFGDEEFMMKLRSRLEGFLKARLNQSMAKGGKELGIGGDF